jgi:AcrR family transcriptional regulator
MQTADEQPTIEHVAGVPEVASLNANQRARRARIIDAAVAMMLVTDHAHIQMKEVSAAADVALGTTYRYFASKDHLLAEALLSWSQGFPALEARRSGGRSVDQLRTAYRLAVRAFEPHPTVYGTMVVLQTSTDPVVERVYDEFAHRQNESFARAIPRIAQPRRDQILMVMGAVLDRQLQRWSLGRSSIESVYDAVDTAAELLLG